jgi:hypothetical protein
MGALATPVAAGSEISIVPAVSGGCEELCDARSVKLVGADAMLQSAVLRTQELSTTALPGNFFLTGPLNAAWECDSA